MTITTPKLQPMATGIAAFLLAVMSLVFVAPARPAAAAERTPIDIGSLDMVPLRTWGVSGQDPSTTQTATLDVLVWDFAQVGDRMFVGGAFFNVQQSKDAAPIAQPYLAAFDVDTGDWISTWRPRIDRAVYALDVAPDGSLLVGGEFQTVNGTARTGLVALDPITGAIDPTFQGSVERPWSSLRAMVRDIEVVGSTVYVAGNFSHIAGADGGRTRAFKVGRFNGPTAVVDPGWTPEVTGSGVWGIDVAPARNQVTIAGYFSAVNGAADSGYFHTVDATTGASIGGMKVIPRNDGGRQPEFFDVAYGQDIVMAIGEQHIIQVLDADDHTMIGFHHTGADQDAFEYTGGFAGGAFQVGERIGNVIFAGCHCTYSERYGKLSHYSSFTGRRTANRLVMAYDATTGRLIESFVPDINSPRDGTWAITSDTNGCLYVGGDFHLGGLDSGRNRWLGGFGKFCPTAGGGGDGGGAGDGGAVATDLIGFGSTWRHDDSGANLGAGWRRSDYNDAGWAVGGAEFGFGDGDERTTWRPGRITYYARTSFDYTGTTPPSLALDLKADDGAVVYLNGVELLRDNMPDGTVSFDTPASFWRSGVDEKAQSFLVPADALRPGTNVVAVEVHNVTADDADLSFDLHLATSTQPVPAPAPGPVAVNGNWAN